MKRVYLVFRYGNWQMGSGSYLLGAFSNPYAAEAKRALEVEANGEGDGVGVVVYEVDADEPKVEYL